MSQFIIAVEDDFFDSPANTVTTFNDGASGTARGRGKRVRASRREAEVMKGGRKVEKGRNSHFFNTEFSCIIFVGKRSSETKNSLQAHV